MVPSTEVTCPHGSLRGSSTMERIRMMSSSRNAFLFLVVVGCLSAGCSGSADRVTAPSPIGPPSGSQQPGTCDASQAQWAVGEPAGSDLLERARLAAGAGTARFLRPNQPITLEYLASRRTSPSTTATSSGRCTAGSRGASAAGGKPRLVDGPSEAARFALSPDRRPIVFLRQGILMPPGLETLSSGRAGDDHQGTRQELRALEGGELPSGRILPLDTPAARVRGLIRLMVAARPA
jgi:hypothetical protein